MNMVALPWVVFHFTPESALFNRKGTGGENSPPFTAQSFFDFPTGFEALHALYLNNTAKLEDKTFAEKKILRDSPSEKSFDLVFKHWLMRRLFVLRETHQKIHLTDAPFPTTGPNFQGLENAEAWLIRKRLLKESRNILIGGVFKALDAYLALIDLGQDKTRVYVVMAVDVMDVKSTADVKNLIHSFFSNLKALI